MVIYCLKRSYENTLGICSREENINKLYIFSMGVQGHPGLRYIQTVGSAK